MADTVRLRPNHYEMLGLTPAASADDISKAFAKQLGQLTVRPFGWLAQVSVAYETLRDPAKRKAYDAALFPKPAGHPVMSQFFRRPVAAAPKPRPTPPEAPAAPEAPEASAAREEWKPAPVAPIMFREPVPAPAAIEPRPAPFPPAPHHDLPESLIADSEAPVNWKLPAAAVAALVVAIAGGAWAGIEVGNDNEETAPQRVATLRIPQATPAPAVKEDPLVAAPLLADVAPKLEKRAPATLARVERNRAPLEIDLPEQASSDQLQPDPEPAVAQEVGVEVPVVAATVATMPLPNATIARTIGRIGYPCGSVASTTAMEGNGVFKVTCTSGHSYRAAPVRGRYRFKRMG